MDDIILVDRFLRAYGPGDVIFAEGDPGQHMYVIASGTVDITRQHGGRAEMLASLGVGTIFGEMALIDHLPRSATGTAGSEGAQLLEIDHALFVYLVGQQPAFALTILKTLSMRMRVHPSEPAPVPAQATKAASVRTDVVQLQENIFQLRGNCMIYVVKGRKKHLVIDAGLPPSVHDLDKQLAEIGLTKDDIHLVVLTHEHIDHIGGLPFFAPHSLVAAHGLAANKIDLQDEFVLLNKGFGYGPDEYHVDLHLHHGNRIDLGGTVLHVLHTPGHCSGSICLYEPEKQVLFTGDTIFAGGVLGGIFPSGSISDYALTLQQLNTLRIQELYPGHGRISKTPMEDLDKAIHGSLNLMRETKVLYGALNSQNEFADMMKAVSTYSKRV